ncbi:MAG TPA: 50S ribosomal protein L31e [Nitrososphaerales archaeon]|nr:50S ribosomal protein L31e [Nitrososphaerales archaeon]
MSDQEIELERVYTVPLSRAWITARHRRTRRAVNILREFAEHHMKSSEIKIDTELNEALWKRGITKPPRRITVKMEKDEDGVVTISLPKETKRKPEEVTPPALEQKAESPAPEKSSPVAKQAPATTSKAPVPAVAPAEEKPKESPAPKKAAAKTPAKKKAAKKSE